MTAKVKVTVYTVLAYSYQVGFYDTHQYFNVNAMPINDTNYSCHIKAIKVLQPII